MSVALAFRQGPHRADGYAYITRLADLSIERFVTTGYDLGTKALIAHSQDVGLLDLATGPDASSAQDALAKIADNVWASIL